MNEHAGLGSVFSVLIVIGFTVVLHEAERAPAKLSPPSAPSTHPVSTLDLVAPARPSSAAIIPPAPVAHPEVSPPPQPGVSVAVIAVVHLPEPGAPGADQSPPVPPELGLSQDERGETIPQVVGVVQPVPSRTGPPEPAPPGVEPRRSSSTIIEKGERLVDVAVRVYGSAEATIKLWRANRDRLSSIDAPVAEGWLLRTP